MPVVEMSPRSQVGESFGRVLVQAGVGPFADGGLDEAFGLAVSARGVNASTNVFELQFVAGLREAVSIKARAVVGHDAAGGDAEASKISHGLAEELAGRSIGFVRQHSREHDTGVVVDGDLQGRWVRDALFRQIRDLGSVGTNALLVVDAVRVPKRLAAKSNFL
jgi:hypothetical protein